MRGRWVINVLQIIDAQESRSKPPTVFLLGYLLCTSMLMAEEAGAGGAGRGGVGDKRAVGAALQARQRKFLATFP